MKNPKDGIIIVEGIRSVRSKGFVQAIGVVCKDFGTADMFREIPPEEANETFNILFSRIQEAIYDLHIDLSSSWEGTKDVLYDIKSGSYYAIEISDMREDKGTRSREVKLSLPDGKSIELCLNFRRNTKIPEKKAYFVQPNVYGLFTSGFPIDYQYGNYPQNVVRLYGGGSQTDEFINAPSLLNIVKDIPALRVYDYSLNSILYGSFTDTQIVREYLGPDTLIDTDKGLVCKFLDEQEENKDSLEINGERKVLVLNLTAQLEVARVKLLEKAWEHISDTIKRINKPRNNRR